MPPAAGLAIRRRTGLGRRRSSACAAARPGSPGGRRTRCYSKGFFGHRVHRQLAQARPRAEDHLCTGKGGQGVLRSLAEVCLRPGGSRRLRGEACAELAQQVPVLLGVLYHLGPGRRFGAKAPRHQPGADRAGRRGQGPLPAAGGPVPGPDGGLGHNGGDCGYPFERPRGPGPVKGQKDQLQPQPGPAVITSHPGIVAPAAGVRQAPGLPPPGRCRPAGPGRRYSGPAASALAPVAHLLKRHLLAGPRGPRHLLPPCGTTCTGDSSRTLVIPSGTSSTWACRRHEVSRWRRPGRGGAGPPGEGAAGRGEMTRGRGQ